MGIGDLDRDGGLGSVIRLKRVFAVYERWKMEIEEVYYCR